jgi:hypothetical protein
MDKTYLTEDLPETQKKAVASATGVEKVVMTVERVGKQIKVSGSVETDDSLDGQEVKTEDKSGRQLLVE